MSQEETLKEKIRKIVPLYPYVLVKLLPKEQKIGRIYAPDVHQNKVLHEGIVLATFKEHERSINRKPVLAKPSVKVGDHILFQHFEGIPADAHLFDRRYYTGEYRYVADNPIGGGRNGILAVLEYDQEKDVKVFLSDIIYGEDREHRDAIVETVMERALVIPKDKGSATLSGA